MQFELIIDVISDRLYDDFFLILLIEGKRHVELLKLCVADDAGFHRLMVLLLLL